MQNKLTFFKTVFCIILFFVNITSNAQLNVDTPTLTIAPNSVINNSNYANDKNFTTKATIFANTGVFVPIVGYVTAPYSSFLTANFNENSKVSSFIKFAIPGKSELLKYLVGGQLGKSLGNSLGNLILGEEKAIISIYEGNTLIDSVNIYNLNFNQKQDIKVVTSGQSDYYIRLNPTQNSHNRIDILLEMNPTLIGLGIQTSLDIYEIFRYRSSNINCDIPLYTSYTATGSILSLLTSNPVTDPHKAIDNDINTASTIGITSLLGLNIGGSTIEQFFYLPKPVNDKKVQFTVRLPVSLLKLDLDEQSQIVFYNGDSTVGTVNLDNNIVGLDVLNLINGNDTKVSFAAAPRNVDGSIKAYDKVGFKLNIPVELDLLDGGDIEIYEVSFINDKPLKTIVCTKEFITNVNGVDIRELKFDIRNIIPNYNSTYVYTIKNSLGENINPNTDPFQPLGSYVISGIKDSQIYCENENVSIQAIPDKKYYITGTTSISIPIDSDNNNIADASHTFSSNDFNVIENITNQTIVSNNYQPIQIFRESDNVNVTGQLQNFSQIGTYHYYAKTTNLTNQNCDILKKITVYVYDKATCDYKYDQLGANFEKADTAKLLGIPLGGTSQSIKAVDSALQEDSSTKIYDLSTHGSIFNLASVLGIGTTWQDLIFKDGVSGITIDNPTKVIPAGTPLTVKLGQDYSVLQVLGGITLQVLDINELPIGPLLSVDEFDLANVLVSDNVFEYTFIPKDGNGNEISFSGVRVYLGSVLGLGNTLKVYGAYIDERIPIENSTCSPNIVVNGAETRIRNANGNLDISLDSQILLNKSVRDVFWGVQDIGLGIATALSSVIYPYQAIDAIDAVGTPLHGTPNYQTGAKFNALVGALNSMSLTVKFKEIVRPGDRPKIVLGHESISILDVNILGDALTIQRYMGNVAVGNPVVVQASSLIELDLLSLINPQPTGKYAYFLESIGAPYDRIEIKCGTIVNSQLLAPKLLIYDVSVVPYLDFELGEGIINLCTSAPLQIEKRDLCTSYNLTLSYPVRNEQNQIIEWIDINNSNFEIINTTSSQINYKITLPKSAININESNELFLKVVTTRQGCVFNDSQYFNIKINACNMLSNPMIRSRLK